MAKFSLKWLFVGIAAVALAVTVVLNANWWLSASPRSLYGVALIVSAVLGIWRKSAFCGGIAVAGLVHTVYTMSNRLDEQVLSSMAIDQLLVEWFSRRPGPRYLQSIGLFCRRCGAWSCRS